jgi:broad specificity phosphatase PhoE
MLRKIRTGHSNEITLYLVRHATPDWTRKDIRYDIPPGPPLTPKGKKEAEQLGLELKKWGVNHIYSSPMQRALHTAQIASKTSGITLEEKKELIENHSGESEEEVINRLWPFMNRCVRDFDRTGPVAMVSHGGPLTLVLKMLGMDLADLDKYCHSFDGNNPLPPAGVWKVYNPQGKNEWEFQLLFVPDVKI